MHFYHILFPSELVEIMGAYDTECSPLFQPLLLAFLVENYGIVLDTGHAGDAAMPGRSPNFKEEIK